MLVLTRRAQQRIFIGKTVAVQVLEIRDGKVKLGFVGPEGIPIDREEVAASRDPDHPLLRRNQVAGETKRPGVDRR